MPVEPADVSIEVGPYGLKKLEVNGTDWTANVSAVQLTVGRDDVPSVVVSITPEPFEYDGPGVVVVQSGAVDEREIIDRFLGQINASDLEALSLQQLDFGVSGTQAILDTLRGLLNG